MKNNSYFCLTTRGLKSFRNNVRTNNINMRLFCIIICMLLFKVSVPAQHLQTSNKTYGGKYSICVIRPTIDNFIYLLNCTESQFKSEMLYYKYFELDTPGKFLSYWNGTLDNFMEAKACTSFFYSLLGNELRCSVPTDMVYPSDAISSLYRDLKPYFVKSGHGPNGNSIDSFKLTKSGTVYEFYLTEVDSSYYITILKK